MSALLIIGCDDRKAIGQQELQQGSMTTGIGEICKN